MIDKNSSELNSFVDSLQTMFDKNVDKAGILKKTVIVKFNRKFIRISTKDTQEMVYCFVDKETGQVFKPASWNAPAKHARGNIFNTDNGMSCCGPYGVARLR